MTELAQLRLWQLISPALPVGAYAYSGGLEAAIEQGDVRDQHSVQQWLQGLLLHSMARIDLPLFARLYAAWQANEVDQVASLNAQLQAMRETHELLAEDRHMGRALQRLLGQLEVTSADQINQPSFATMYALACLHWQVDQDAGIHGLVWSWLENQVTIAVKLIPLGQTQGQQLLGDLLPYLQQAVSTGLSLGDDDIGASLPGLALLSAAHEHQYSRLFRS